MKTIRFDTKRSRNRALRRIGQESARQQRKRLKQERRFILIKDEFSGDEIFISIELWPEVRDQAQKFHDAIVGDSE